MAEFEVTLIYPNLNVLAETVFRGSTMDDANKRRERMVLEQIEVRGVRDRKVLDAMGKVRREAFVP